MKRQMKLIRNRIKCKKCSEIIESKYTHDWVCCSCFHESDGKTGCFVDGGTSYQRIGGHPEYIENLSEWRPFTDEERDEYNENKLRLAEQYPGLMNIDLME